MMNFLNPQSSVILLALSSLFSPVYAADAPKDKDPKTPVIEIVNAKSEEAGGVYLGLSKSDPLAARTLKGAPLDNALKDQLKIEFIPSGAFRRDQPILLTLNMSNKGNTPLEFYMPPDDSKTGYFGYSALSPYASIIFRRDTQLSFRAIDAKGAAVPITDPLQSGYCNTIFTLKPYSQIRRTVDMSLWLQFKNPGRYGMEATYPITLKNPRKGAMPAEWKLTYTSRFDIEIKE